MAATGYTPISLYYSTTASAVPTSGNLANGELGLNIADMKLYAKNSAGTVTLLASSSGATGTVSSVAATVPSFLSITGSPITTSGTLAISLSGSALPTTSGGTGLTSFTSGGVVYASSTSALATGSALTFDGLNFAAGRVLSGRYTSDANNWGIQNYSATSAFGSGIQLVYGGVGAAAIWVPAASSLAFGADVGAGTTEQMRLTSTGLGIGTNSPAYKLDVQTSAGRFQVQNYGSGSILLNSDGAMAYKAATVGHQFFNGSTQAMTLDASGNFLVGATSVAALEGYRFYKNYGRYDNGTFVGFLGGGTALGSTAASDFYLRSENALAFGAGGLEKFRIASTGAFGLSGANYGTSGQVLTSGGSGAAPTWASAGGGSGFTAKTTNYTAASGDNILANTSAGSWTLTLPASPSTGNAVQVMDSIGTFGQYPLTVARNGSTIMSAAENMTLDVNGAATTFVYNGSTWRVI